MSLPPWGSRRGGEFRAFIGVSVANDRRGCFSDGVQTIDGKDATLDARRRDRLTRRVVGPLFMLVLLPVWILWTGGAL